MRLTEPDLAAIRASRLFSMANPDTVWLHLQHATPVEIASGDVLVAPGQEDTGIHLVVWGEIAICLDSQGDNEIARIRAGGCIGERSMVDERRALTLAVARAPSRILSFAPPQLWELMRAEPAIALNLIRMLSESTRSSNLVLLDSMKRQLQLQLSATTDPLTGLRNRRWMEEMFARSIARAERSGTGLALAMFDIDGFGELSGTHGPTGGEHVLQQVAKLAYGQLRPTDQCVRYSGEKFCALLSEATGLGAERTAERLRGAIVATPMTFAEGHAFAVTASFGVVEWHAGMNLADLVSAAEAALLQAKQSGHNCVVRSETAVSGGNTRHIKAA